MMLAGLDGLKLDEMKQAEIETSWFTLFEIEWNEMCCNDHFDLFSVILRYWMKLTCFLIYAWVQLFF